MSDQQLFWDANAADADYAFHAPDAGAFAIVDVSSDSSSDASNGTNVQEYDQSVGDMVFPVPIDGSDEPSRTGSSVNYDDLRGAA